MMRSTLIRQIFPLYLAILALAFTGLVFYVSYGLTSLYYDQMKEKLADEAGLAANAISPEVLRDSRKAGELIERLSRGHPVRFTLILPDGTVTADSSKDPALLENHGDRPEVIRALKGEPASSRRFSDSLSAEFLYFALPLFEGAEIAGAVRAAAKLEAPRNRLDELKEGILLAGLAAALLASAGSYLIVRKFNSPLLEIQAAAQRFAQGDLELRLAIDKPEEMKSLASTMNWMAGQLKNRIDTISIQRKELEAILAGMMEAVIVLDARLTVKSMNRAAEKLLGKSRDEVVGRNLLEHLRASEIDSLVKEILSGEGPVEKTLLLYGPEKTLHLQVHGTLLEGVSSESPRLLLVLNDVTRLKRLEEMRKDFVANVSHELKTPITSIQGFVESLKDGALQDGERARQFLGIVEKQAKRLNAIIEDLLSLSRLEQAETKIKTSRGRFSGVLDRVFEICLPRADEKGIKLVREAPEELEFEFNETLLEQALVNLVDNAVKYSEGGTSIVLRAFAGNGSVLLSVKDEGPGISARDLPRIFERFYRVDKTRSRALGGTGLGLAIVKHIVLAHRGTVWAESEPGKGSEFFIRLPS